MDSRVREHAETLVDWSARIEDGDDVIVDIGEGAHDLGVAVAEKLGERGANYHATYRSPEMGGRISVHTTGSSKRVRSSNWRSTSTQIACFPSADRATRARLQTSPTRNRRR